jgi:hypothetical protein
VDTRAICESHGGEAGNFVCWVVTSCGLVGTHQRLKRSILPLYSGLMGVQFLVVVTKEKKAALCTFRIRFSPYSRRCDYSMEQ